MKRYIIMIVVLVLLAAFFFLPVIPSQYVFMTQLQKEKEKEFCSQHGCGLLFLSAPMSTLKIHFIT